MTRTTRVTASFLGANRRRPVVAGIGAAIGLVALGFTSVYREGFEVVLFLQTLELQAGTSTVLEGVALGLAGTAIVGVLTFALHRKLPYGLARHLKVARPRKRGLAVAIHAEAPPDTPAYAA